MNFSQTPWKHDYKSKQFSSTTFRFGGVKEFPATLGRPKATPLDQGNTLRCAAYAAAMNGHYIHGSSFSPDWQEDKISRLQGKDVDIAGSDPNAAMASQLFSKSGGYLPLADWQDGKGTELDSEAQNYGGEAYIKPNGGMDIFDSIRSELLEGYDPIKKLGPCVQAFGKWYGEWTYAPYVLSGYTNFKGYHSWLFVDWVELNGVTYLVAQNSYGIGVGQNGFHYFPREIVNYEFSQWGTSLKIPRTLTPEQIATAKQSGAFGDLQRAIINAWYALTLILLRYGIFK